jgi:hypothetical protein
MTWVGDHKQVRYIQGKKSSSQGERQGKQEAN